MKKIEDYEKELLWIKCLEEGLEEILRIYNRYKYPHILETAKKQKVLITQEEASLNAIREGVKKLDDPLLIDILTMRYLQGKTGEETAEALFFSYCHISRLTRKARKELNKVLSETR